MPDEVAADGAPTGGRYDHVVRLFGEKFVKEKIMNARTFMVRKYVTAVALSWFPRGLSSKMIV